MYAKYVIREIYVIHDLKENRRVIRDWDPLYHPADSIRLGTQPFWPFLM